MTAEDKKKLVSMLQPKEYESKIRLYCNIIRVPKYKPFSAKLLIKSKKK